MPVELHVTGLMRDHHLPTWSIKGLTSDTLMTMHGALTMLRDELVNDINKYMKAEKDLQVYEDGEFHDRVTVITPVYCSDEDLLFLSEELRKVTELMFRIKTEPGVF